MILNRIQGTWNFTHEIILTSFISHLHNANGESINGESSLQLRLREVDGAGGIRTHDLLTCTVDAGELPSLLEFASLCPSMGAYW